jgi:hypothetical protein
MRKYIYSYMHQQFLYPSSSQLGWEMLLMYIYNFKKGQNIQKWTMLNDSWPQIVIGSGVFNHKIHPDGTQTLG